MLKTGYFHETDKETLVTKLAELESLRSRCIHCIRNSHTRERLYAQIINVYNKLADIWEEKNLLPFLGGVVSLNILYWVIKYHYLKSYWFIAFSPIKFYVSGKDCSLIFWSLIPGHITLMPIKKDLIVKFYPLGQESSNV